jgi:hypothetical protein
VVVPLRWAILGYLHILRNFFVDTSGVSATLDVRLTPTLTKKLPMSQRIIHRAAVATLALMLMSPLALAEDIMHTEDKHMLVQAHHALPDVSRLPQSSIDALKAQGITLPTKDEMRKFFDGMNRIKKSVQALPEADRAELQKLREAAHKAEREFLRSKGVALPSEDQIAQMKKTAEAVRAEFKKLPKEQKQEIRKDIRKDMKWHKKAEMKSKQKPGMRVVPQGMR